MSGRRLAALAALCALLLMARAGALSEDAGDYRIEVDIASQITTVYRQEDGSVARQMICSTGLNDATPRGSFQLEASRPADRQAWYFIGQYQCFVKYPTRIRGSILFHSLPYTQKDMGALDPVALEQLGAKASHGCVRLRWPDARWIAMHCPDGTQTRIFTGTARQETLRALLMERSYTGAQGETYEEFIAPIAADGSTALRRGDSGKEVEALQRRLAELGWYTARVTGEYDDATLIAVTRCQASEGLPATGVATQTFLRRIMEKR